MKTAFQMDHPSRLNARTDSTLMLLEAAQKRGHACHFYEPGTLSWNNGELLASLASIRFSGGDRPSVELGDFKTASLHEMGVVWMRQDPPFNLKYITATHLLEHLTPTTRVVNDPKGVRNAPEKLSALHVKELMPPTLVSLDRELIHAFAKEHKTVVAKPLHGHGGRSVFKLSADDANIDTLIEQWSEQVGEPLMWQPFLKEVAKEDARIILIGGEVASIFTREPAAGSIRANMRVGGTPKKTDLTPRQKEVCDKLRPVLQENGLIFVGLDMIGDYLTEINVTSPTGLRAVETLYGVNLATELWDSVEALQHK